MRRSRPSRLVLAVLASLLVGGSGQEANHAALAGWNSGASLINGALTRAPKDRLGALRDENQWKNELVLWVLPGEVRECMPRVVQVGRACSSVLRRRHTLCGRPQDLPVFLTVHAASLLQTWFRCWVMCMALYFGVGAAWTYYAYFAFGASGAQGRTPS